MRYINIFFVMLFLLFAALQYNDPDPYVWMPLYLYGSILCWLASKKIYKSGLYITGILVYASYALYLLFDKDGPISLLSQHHAESIVHTMKATKPWIEETREFLGLLILLVISITNMIWFSRLKRQQFHKSPEYIEPFS